MRCTGRCTWRCTWGVQGGVPGGVHTPELPQEFQELPEEFHPFFFQEETPEVTPSLFSPRNSVSTRPLSRSVRQHAAHTHRLTFISLCALACWLALERVTILRARMHTAVTARYDHVLCASGCLQTALQWRQPSCSGHALQSCAWCHTRPNRRPRWLKRRPCSSRYAYPSRCIVITELKRVTESNIDIAH
jgi:hypothetical protein